MDAPCDELEQVTGIANGSRYSVHYKITLKELTWLGERVRLLQQLTETLCLEKIASSE